MAEEYDDQEYEDEEYEDEEYSDQKLQEILERVHEWGGEWSESPHFQSLTETQKEESESVVGFFTEYMYSYHGLAPQKWDESTLEECCLETLPRKISAEESYFASIAPVLAAFFTFLSETGRLPQGPRLARAVKAIDRKIVQHATDPRYWGMAKSFVMGAKAAGVDPTNESEMNAYMLHYNLSLLSQSEAARLPPGLGLPEPMRPARIAKIGRNEPCPCGSGKKYKKCCGR